MIGALHTGADRYFYTDIPCSHPPHPQYFGEANMILFPCDNHDEANMILIPCMHILVHAQLPLGALYMLTSPPFRPQKIN